MLASLDRSESNKRNLHTGQRSQRVPGSVTDVETSAVSSHADKDKGVHGQQASNEGITAPRSHHVAIEKGTEGTPEH